jgi:cyclic pyranopterin phosphate synthase
MSKVENLFAKSAYRIETRNLHNRRKYFLQNGEAEVVRSMHNSEFCKHCTRIRITSDGRIKPCLFQPYEDLKVMNAIRENDMKKAREIFLKAIEMRKPYWM